MFVLSVVFIVSFAALKHAGLIGCYLLFELFSKIKSGSEKSKLFFFPQMVKKQEMCETSLRRPGLVGPKPFPNIAQ